MRPGLHPRRPRAPGGGRLRLTLWRIPGYDPTVPAGLYSTHLVLWLFALGWMLQRAVTPGQRWATVVATLVLVPSFFGVEHERAAVAWASLGIYLTHFALLPLLTVGVPPAVLVVLGLTLGVAAWTLGNAVIRAVVRGRAARRSSRARQSIMELGTCAQFHDQVPSGEDGVSRSRAGPPRRG